METFFIQFFFLFFFLIFFFFLGGRGHGGDGYSAREFVILFFFPPLFLCSVFASVRLHGFSEERGHFCNVISHHCFGAPRKGDAVSTPCASLILCLLLLWPRSVCDSASSFLFLLTKVRHAAVSRTRRGASIGNRRRRTRAGSQQRREVALSSSPRRSFLKILWRIERSAAGSSDAHLYPASLIWGGEKRPNSLNRCLVSGPDATN